MICTGVLFVILILLAAGMRCCKKDAFLDDYLSIKTTTAEKGIAAILIVLHHLMQMVSVPRVMSVMGYIGILLVAVFFFLSGYGLMYGVSHKENYLKGFLKKHLLSILIPYWIINILVLLVYIVRGNTITIAKVALSILGIDTLTGTWFVTAILVMYVAFYVAFSIGKKFRSDKIAITILCVEIALYCIACFALQLHSSWTASIVAFIMGIIWMHLDKQFVKWLRKSYWGKMIAIAALFGILFVGRLFLSYIGMKSEIFHFILRNGICILFVLLMLCLSQKVDFKSKLSLWLGNISYELYIVHYVLLLISNAQMKSSVLFVPAILALSISGAWILHKASRKIIHKLQS